MVSFSDVEEAAANLAGVAHRTPILTSHTLATAVGAAHVHCKAEQFQRVGAFKFRGAYHAVTGLASEVRARGVITYSSGNHAQALALAASLLAIPAVIVMPSDAPSGKLAATRGYGAEVVTYDRYDEDRVELAERIAKERGLALIPPFDHPRVIAGQGTLAMELLDEVGDLDALFVPVGGGGLAAGCAIATHGRSPATRVIGVEPEGGDDTKRSLAAGRRIRIDVPRTIADGLQVDCPGELTFPVLAAHLTDIVLVSDADIVEAMRFAFERMKVVCEPSGATALAAVLAGRFDVTGLRVGIVLSGGNVDPTRFCELLAGAGGSSVRRP